MKRVFEFIMMLYFFLGAEGIVCFSIMREQESNLFTKCLAFLIALALLPFWTSLIFVSWVSKVLNERKENDKEQ